MEEERLQIKPRMMMTNKRKNNTKQQFRGCHKLRIKPPNQIAFYTKQLEAI